MYVWGVVGSVRGWCFLFADEGGVGGGLWCLGGGGGGHRGWGCEGRVERGEVWGGRDLWDGVKGVGVRGIGIVGWGERG